MPPDHKTGQPKTAVDPRHWGWHGQALVTLPRDKGLPVLSPFAAPFSSPSQCCVSKMSYLAYRKRNLLRFPVSLIIIPFRMRIFAYETKPAQDKANDRKRTTCYRPTPKSKCPGARYYKV